jgi:hypothetical protein
LRAKKRVDRGASYRILKRLVSGTSAQFRNGLSCLLSTIPSTLVFAPRLNPPPQMMPGGWSTTATPTTTFAPERPSSTSDVCLAPSPTPRRPQARRPSTYSRVAQRPSSNTYTVKHFCPMVSSEATPRSINDRSKHCNYSIPAHSG